MSRDADHQWHNDSDQELRYFKEPAPGCDLSAGFDTFVKKDEEKEKQEHITPILSWLHHQRAGGSRASEMDVIAHPQFVAWRGSFARLLCAPYNRSESWRLLVCRFKGTIYIADKDTPETLARRRNQTQREELMGYWGYKFEDYSTRPRTGLQEPNEGPVSNIPCYCTVVRARLGSHLLLMSGETDCCMEGQAKPPDNYVELKTNKVLMTERDRTSFERYKLLKFWSQSFLAGVPRVVVGFRDDEGIVRTVQHFKTLELPRFVEGKRNMWDSAVCMNFCDQFLTWVAWLFEQEDQEKTTSGGDDDAKVVWALDYGAPFSHVQATRFKDGSLAFLPAWFTSATPTNPPSPHHPPPDSTPHA